MSPVLLSPLCATFPHPTLPFVCSSLCSGSLSHRPPGLTLSLSLALPLIPIEIGVQEGGIEGTPCSVHPHRHHGDRVRGTRAPGCVAAAGAGPCAHDLENDCDSAAGECSQLPGVLGEELGGLIPSSHLIHEFLCSGTSWASHPQCPFPPGKHPSVSHRQGPCQAHHDHAHSVPMAMDLPTTNYLGPAHYPRPLRSHLT